MSRERITETIAWRSDDPHLTGNFAPIGSEIDADELEVVAGEIPEDLFGTYIRNGPNPRYEPVSYNYPLEGDGMLHAIRFEGGRASNIVPETCAFRFDIRHLAGTDPDDLTSELRGYAGALLDEMRKVHPGSEIAFEQMGEVPALDEPEGSAWCQKVLAAAGETATGRVSFGTEAGLFQRAGVPSVVCGPGNIAVAHRANEYVSLDQLARSEAMLRRLTGVDALQ